VEAASRLGPASGTTRLLAYNKTMSMRQLGASGVQVSNLCLGGNVFGWTADESTSFAILDAFVDAGLNFVDTADVYSIWVPGHTGGESETVIGAWFAHSGKRDKVILATKFGKPMGGDKKGLSKAYMLRAVDESLRRLRTDYIDLYQSHDDDSATPLEETMEAFSLLIQQGKVRAIGASNYSAARLEEALATSARTGQARYECLQPHYNLCERAAYEAEQESVCRRAGIGVIPYFSLASGFLTGKYRSEADLGKSARGAFAKRYFNDRGLAILRALDEIAPQVHATPGQVALAWLMARPGITAPIASATNLTQLQELIAATTLELDASVIAALDRASA
jgi:aryl-alcohol dehydrogenase-like predicted oxidoreductase